MVIQHKHRQTVQCSLMYKSLIMLLSWGSHAGSGTAHLVPVYSHQIHRIYPPQKLPYLTCLRQLYKLKTACYQAPWLCGISTPQNRCLHLILTPTDMYQTYPRQQLHCWSVVCCAVAHLSTCSTLCSTLWQRVKQHCYRWMGQPGPVSHRPRCCS